MDEEENPYVTAELCEAYRRTLQNEIQGMKDDIETIDSRVWKILAGIIVTILLLIVSIAVNYV